jgi:hypothetical protein
MVYLTKEAGRDPITDRGVRIAGDELEDVLRDGRPAWPEEVREIYSEDLDALPLSDCANCGLPLPVRPGENAYKGGKRVTVRPAYNYFDQCPVCGGSVGYEAYYRSRDAS